MRGRRLIKRTSNTYSPRNALTRAVASVLAIAPTGQVIHKDAWTRAWDEYLQKAHLDPAKRESLFSCSPQDIMTTLTSWEIQHTDKSKLRRFMDFLDPLFKGLARFALALDVYSNAVPFGILFLIWGGLRLVLMVNILHAPTCLR